MGIALITRWLSLVVDVIDLDETCHIVGSWVLMQGKTLYVDFVDNKPPLLYVAYALAQMVGGQSLTGVRAVIVLVVVPLTAVAVSRFDGHQRQGLVAAVVFLVSSASFVAHDMLAASAELLMILPGAWAVVLVGSERAARSPTRHLAAGLLFGVAVCIKPQIAVWAVACAAAPLHPSVNGGRFGAWIRAVAALALGVLVAPGIVLAWFAYQGATSELYSALVQNNIWYARHTIETTEALTRAARYALPFALATAPLWWAMAHTREPWSYRRLLVTLLTIGSVLPALLGWRFYPHYFIQLYVPLAWGAAPWIVARLHAPMPRSLAIAGAWMAVMAAGFMVANAVLYLESNDVYQERAPVSRRVAERLRADPCARGGSLFVWGWAPMIYYHARLDPASRFVALSQARLTTYVPGNRREGDASTVIPEHWDRLLTDLDRSGATFIADTAPADLFGWGRYPVSRFPRLQRYLDTHYELVDSVSRVRLYRRRGCDVAQ